MKVIGLTGGIGSGKSTLLRWFKNQGVPCFESDVVGKHLLNNELRKAVFEEFGSTFFKKNGSLNTEFLAKKVFNDVNALSNLNRIVHPAVSASFETFKSNYRNENFIVKEAAILIETGAYKNCDTVILVKAPLFERIRRISLRDGIKKAEVLSRMKNQWSDKIKEAYADYIIQNSNYEECIKQISGVMNILRKIQ